MYCQRCRAPIKIDKSLEDLNPAAFDLLVGATGTTPAQYSALASVSRPNHPQERRELYDQTSQNDQPPVFKRTIPPPRVSQPQSRQGEQGKKLGPKDNPAMSFVMLTDSQVVTPSLSHMQESSRPSSKSRRQPNSENTTAKGEKRSLSDQMEATTRLFEILSARSDVDHPICAECTDLLVEGLEKRLENTTRERDAYVDFFKKVNSELPTEEETKKVEEDLRSAREQEEKAFAELQKLEDEKSAINAEIAALEEEARQLDEEEEQFWRERNAFALTLSEFQNERDAINLKYDHDSRQLERLQRTNVYNDTFCIGHDGFFGTINGLRLGRLANQTVDWAEINAAWGQTLLLLATVAEKLGFTFDSYRLKPMGSTSKIEKLEYPPPTSAASPSTGQTANPKVSVLELYSSGDLPLGRMFLHRRFDIAMVAFLDCLRQLGAFVERGSRQGRGGEGTATAPGQGLKLPYEIKKDRIGDASIKLGFNQDEAWTRACKYTLTCCKFLLAHASNIGSSGRRSAS